jgi:hypothetical protein
VIEVLQEGIRQNMTLSMPSLVRSRGQFEKLLSTPPEQSAFFALLFELDEHHGIFAATDIMEDEAKLIELGRV